MLKRQYTLVATPGSKNKRRELRKIRCESCKSNGHVEKKRTKTCSSCSGQGWSLDDSGEEQLCSNCNGDGKVSQFYKSQCACCFGKGYIVKIIEITESEIKCRNCLGSGIDEEDLGQIIACPACSESTDDVRKSCFICDGYGEIGGEICLCQILFNGRPFEEIVGSYLFDYCSFCEDNEVVHLSLYCPSCSGSGIEVEESEREIIPKGLKK